MSNKKPTYTEVWNTLSQVDVSKHTETIGTGNYTLSYLSWAWAWGVMMENYPEAKYEFTTFTDGSDVRVYEDGTCSVECFMTICELTRTMWLPVMDNRHKAIQTPNALQISNAKMRCLTKCLAMWGLGHYIYSGEDLTQAPTYKTTEDQKARFSSLLESKYYDGSKNKVKEWWGNLATEKQVESGLQYMQRQVETYNEKKAKKELVKDGNS